MVELHRLLDIQTSFYRCQFFDPGEQGREGGLARKGLLQPDGRWLCLKGRRFCFDCADDHHGCFQNMFILFE